MSAKVNMSALSLRGQTALGYACKGFAVIPGDSTGDTKRPLIKWKSGEDGPIVNDDRDAYSKKVAEWWGKYRNADIFLITGAPSDGICVVDLDEHPDRSISGLDTLGEWEAEHGPLFGDGETVSAITGSGGCHIYFRDERGGLAGYAQPAGSFLGVDVRANGQLAVLPPSGHKSGRTYEWEFDPDEYEILPATDNLYEFIEHCRPGASRGGEPSKDKGWFSLPEEIAQGHRDETIYRLACSLQGKGMPDSYILEKCIAANRLRCKPPLSDEEVKQKVASALTKPKGHHVHTSSSQKGSTVKSSDVASGGGNGNTGGGSAATKDKSAKQAPVYPDYLYKVDKDGNIVGICHELVGSYLLKSDFGACRIGGSPHLFNFESGIYEPGWSAFDRAVIDIYPAATQKMRQEVDSWLNVMLPDVEREAPGLIPFTNGILNVECLMDGADDFMMPYSPSMHITHQIPHEYNPDAECDEVDKFLDDVSCGDEEIRLNIVEAFGLAMYPGRNVIQEVPDLIGFDAGNGKTTTLLAMESVVGPKNCCHVKPSDLSHDHKSRALDGKLVCFMDEVPLDHWDSQTSSTLKNAITGGYIYCDVKYHSPYEFKNIALIVLAANGYPRFSGKEADGLMRRLRPIEMKANFKEDNPNRDIHVLEKITTEEACEYWIRIGVSALVEVIRRGGFSPSAASRRLCGEIRSANDTVLAWVEDEDIKADSVKDKPTQSAYAKYKDWCQGGGLKPLGKIEFVKRVNAILSTKSVSKWCSSLQKNVKCFVGGDDDD